MGLVGQGNPQVRELMDRLSAGRLLPEQAGSIRERLDEHVSFYLLPISGFLFLFFSVLVPTHLAVMPAGLERDVVVACALLSAALLGTLTLTLRRIRVPSRWAHLLAFGTIMIPLANSLLHMGLTGDAIHTTNVMLVILATGAIVLRLKWLVLTQAMAVGGWAVVALLAVENGGDWFHFGFGVFLSLLVAVVVYRMHVASLVGLEHLNLELDDLAHLDGLTGIANRRAFDDRLAREWDRHVEEETSLAVVTCDLDQFKLLNDTRGHGAGDVALGQVAGVLRATARSEDDLPARVGGEEFALLLPRTTGEQAMLVAERIRDGVARLNIPNPDAPPPSTLTVSLGVADTVPRSGDRPSSFMSAADEALYQAKAQGRNRSVRSSAKR